ncbi:hypothetical protein HOY80DRAFT_996880 [Tuber brumale]|nr:hypothetical protein HOY80DRAFT_996880 [Tuber brumale]
MGIRKYHSSIKSSLATATVLQQTVEMSLALDDNHNQEDCESWFERMVEEEKRLERVEFAGGVDIEPLVMEEEVTVVAEKKIVVRLPVAVTESVAGAEVAEDVAMVEVVGKGKEVAVVAAEAEEGVGSQEEDWTLVKCRMRESGEDRRRRMLEEERDAVRKSMNVWHPAKVVVPNVPLGPRGPSGLFERVVCGESVEKVGKGVAPRLPVVMLKGPRAYGGMALGGEKRLSFKGLGSVPKGRMMYGPDSGRGLVVYGAWEYRKLGSLSAGGLKSLRTQAPCPLQLQWLKLRLVTQPTILGYDLSHSEFSIFPGFVFTMLTTKTIESLRKENSNLYSTNAKILERIKEMKKEMDSGYEVAVGKYREECFKRVMLRIEEEVEKDVLEERKRSEEKFGELNAGFRKEEER